MSLVARLFESTTEKYREEIGEEKYRNEIDYIQELPQKFDNRVWDWSDLEDVVRWKSSRALADFRSNDEEMVNDTLRDVIETPSTINRLQHLRSLDGIQVPIASSFLMFIDPREYTVIDERAWNTLRRFDYVSGDFDNYSNEQYLLYLGICRTLATEYDVDLRTLDRALWVLGK